jgi:hypothetical protein
MKQKNEFWAEKLVCGENLLMERIYWRDFGQRQLQLPRDYGVQRMLTTPKKHNFDWMFIDVVF